AKQCPQGSIYGHVTATTPLLDYTLQGPVYLRSSDHELPDLVAVVRGPDYPARVAVVRGPASQPIEAAVVGRIDSIKGQIRSTFEAVPDVPLTKVVLDMQGGKKGLLINSRDICRRAFRVDLKLEGHNGAEADGRPALKNGKCGEGRKHRAKHAHH